MKSARREVLVRTSVHCGGDHCLHCRWLSNGKCSLFATKTVRMRRLSWDSRFRMLRLDECKEAEAMARDVLSAFERRSSVIGSTEGGQGASWRDHLGRVLRGAWLGWARQQPDPKPSWLLPWEELPAEHQEVDMLMAEAVLASVLQPRSPSPELADAEERLRGGPGALEMAHTEIIAAELDRLRGEVARLSRESGKAAGEP